MKRFLYIFFTFLVLSANAQEPIKISEKKLDSRLVECSGLTGVNDKLVTINDSRDGAYLYELSKETGLYTRRVYIKNATNIDWEDLCTDDRYIYIGDFGNNRGIRTDLKIYKVLISEFITQDTANAEVINFNYVDQADFTDSVYYTNHDAESIISYKDSLYIITKNWRDKQSNVYPVSKTPGTYSLIKKEQLPIKGLLSGASYNDSLKTLVISGYSYFDPFIFIVRNMDSLNFSNLQFEKYSMDLDYNYQIEGIELNDNGRMYLTSETTIYGDGSLTELSINEEEEEEEEEEGGVSSIFDKTTNPELVYSIKNKRLFLSKNEGHLKLVDLKGITILSAREKSIDVSKVTPGIYLAILFGEDGDVIFSKKVCVY